MTDEHPTYVIHRHAIPTWPGQFTLPIYDDADIVHVGIKHEQVMSPNGAWDDWAPHLWTRHRTDLARPAVVPERRFRVVATGEEHTGTHHGTWIDASYVWHLLEDTP